MLILTRNSGESIIINNNIVVRVLSIRGGQIRLGIDAPKEISVHREEIHDKIQLEKGAEEQKDGLENETD